MNDNTKSNSIPILKTLVNNTETIHDSDEEKAGCLNNYFVSISTVEYSSTS